MEHFEDFSSMMASLQKKRRTVHLLVGNGFSMAYDPQIFSYNALADFVVKMDDPLLSEFFAVLNTKNFELIMDQLTTFSKLLEVLKVDSTIQSKVFEAHAKLKNSLLDAIKSLHPEHVFKIPNEKKAKCAEFLENFLNTGGEIFSTNYDLLLYWVLMSQNIPRAVDGFGRDLLTSPEDVKQGVEPEYSELRWGPNKRQQNIHYLHGALPIFDAGTEIVKEQYDGESYLLENIGKRLDVGEYPVFVTAGNGDQKLDLIRHNRYLTFCYDRLCEVDGSVVTFGFGFGQYDEHIIHALNIAFMKNPNFPKKLRSVYIGVYSSETIDFIRSIEHKFYAKVYTFDVKSANPWH